MHLTMCLMMCLKMCHLCQSDLKLKSRLRNGALLLMTFVTLINSACDGTLRGLNDTLTPLMQVQLTLPQKELVKVPPENQARLRVGILWLQPTFPSEWCAQWFTALIDVVNPRLIEGIQLFQGICRNPLGVAPQRAGPSVPLSSGVQEGDHLYFQINFDQLPPSEVIYGAPDARIAYGTIIVFEDLDGDETFSIGEADRLRLLDSGESPDSNSERQARQRRRGDPQEPDRLYGVSFSDLLSAHVRLVFREGDYLPSLFYPLGVKCIPPKGLSLIQVTSPSIDLNQSEPCEILDPSLPFSLSLVSDTTRFREVACEPTTTESSPPTSTAPRSRGGGEEVVQRCISPEHLALSSSETSCEDFIVMSLVDCPPNHPDCDDPYWDLRAAPPLWWPCGGE